MMLQAASRSSGEIAVRERGGSQGEKEEKAKRERKESQFDAAMPWQGVADTKQLHVLRTEHFIHVLVTQRRTWMEHGEHGEHQFSDALLAAFQLQSQLWLWL